jgi:predicted  nucleic acid-binding Zn-ribbon protein
MSRFSKKLGLLHKELNSLESELAQIDEQRAVLRRNLESLQKAGLTHGKSLERIHKRFSQNYL